MFKKDEDFKDLMSSTKKDSTESVIGPSVHLEGNFNSSGNVIVVGSLSGSLTTTGDVQVEEGAMVQATIQASHIFVSGEVKGDIHATEQLELSPSARVSGNIEAKVLSVSPGAILHGKCVMKNIGKKITEDTKKEKGKKGSKAVEEVLEEAIV